RRGHGAMMMNTRSKILLMTGGCILVTIFNIVLLPTRHTGRVTAETVTAAPLALVVRAPGNVGAKASVTIKAQFDGTLDSKSYHEGQKVAAGDLLGVINRD